MGDTKRKPWRSPNDMQDESLRCEKRGKITAGIGEDLSIQQSQLDAVNDRMKLTEWL